MDFLLVFSVLLFRLGPVFANEDQGVGRIYGRPVKSSSLWAPLKRQLLRSKRSTAHKITECVFATSEEGSYYYAAEGGSDEACGVYLFAEPDEVIEIRLEYVDVRCESGGLVAFFDGWELNGKFFPGVDDHEKRFGQRHREFCGSEMGKRVFVTSQNAGMLHYRIPDAGRGFGFHVKFLKNPAPCNILAESEEGFYTLRNRGKASNCSLVAVFPAKIKVLTLEVGVLTGAAETGTRYQCDGKISDGLQIGGSENLDSSDFVLFEDLCGLDSFPGMRSLVVGCEVSVVKLASSGRYDNSVTFSVAQPERAELLESKYAC